MNPSQIVDPRKRSVWMQSGAMKDVRTAGPRQCPKDKSFMKKDVSVYRCGKCGMIISRL